MNFFFFLQITVICTFSVYISIFVKTKRDLIDDPRIDGLLKKNDSCANQTFYTGLSTETFHDNIFSKYRSFHKHISCQPEPAKCK